MLKLLLYMEEAMQGWCSFDRLTEKRCKPFLGESSCCDSSGCFGHLPSSVFGHREDGLDGVGVLVGRLAQKP